MADVYTSDDLVAVTNAIRALMAGTRVVTVLYSASGTTAARSVTYGAANLNDLRSLQAEIQREVNGTPTYRRVSFNKGFDPDNSGSGLSG